MQRRILGAIFLVFMALYFVRIPAQNTTSSLADDTNNRTGRWVFYLDADLNASPDSLNFTYTKVVNYVSGRPIGFVNYYYKSGKLYFQTPVKSLDPDIFSDGEIRYFSENGDKLKTVNYLNGMLNGMAEEYFPDGKLKKQGLYTDGQKSGIWKQWEQDGKYGIGSFENDVPEGKWTFYYADGAIKSVGKFKDGIQSGVWTEYSATGDIAEGTYLNGLPEGTWVSRYKNDKPRYIGSFNKGLKEGYWQEWDALGSLSKGNYLNDARDASWTILDSNGNKLAEGNYLNGKEDGIWKRFDAVGNVIETILYQNGVLLKQ
jgi:antitoxin component YwqK of YwqJK toxin-antitoxin module